MREDTVGMSRRRSDADEYVGALDVDRGTIKPFDTVRGLFPEGEPAYEGAGFLKKTRTQIAMREPDGILGVFWPRARLVAG